MTLKAEQAAKAAYKLIAPGRYHHPLNPLNPGPPLAAPIICI